MPKACCARCCMPRSSTTSERTRVENFNLNDLMAQAAAMQSQLQSAQDKLAATGLTGTAGGGLVTATIKGTGELVGLVIKPEACDPEDLSLIHISEPTRLGMIS